MSWELRGGRWVYYRARRVNGQVVKEYCGTGVLAEFAADEDTATQMERRSKLEGERAERETLRDPDAALVAFDAQTKAAVRQVLATAGYHQHKRGEWRKARG